jgi:uncharacterized membrane protein
MNSPIKPSFKTEAISIVTVIAAIATAVISYEHLPARVISHWNFYGQADAWSSREFHVYFFPALTAGMYLLFLVVPNLDPKKERYQDFIKPYNVFRTTILFVIYLIYLLATLVNVGYEINIAKTVPLLIGGLMIMLGNYMGKIKKNWFVGIRTPWTLSSENVWNKTHRLGGAMFVLFGLTMIITPFLSKVLGLTLFALGIIGITIIPMTYSYILYRREKK